MWAFFWNMIIYGVPFIIFLMIAMGLLVLVLALGAQAMSKLNQKKFYKLLINPNTVWHKIDRHGSDYDERYTFRIYDDTYSHYTLNHNHHDGLEYKTNRYSKTAVSYAPLRELYFTKIFNFSDGDEIAILVDRYEFAAHNVILNNRTLLAIIADPEVIPVMAKGSTTGEDDNVFDLYSDNKEKIVSYKLKS